MRINFLPFPTIACIHAQEHNLTTIAKRLRSSSHGEIQLKLFNGGSVLNPTLLKNTVVAEMVSFKEASVDIIGFDKQKGGKG